MSVIGLSEQEIVRRQSLEELRRLGVNPYPAQEYHVNNKAKCIVETFDDEKPEILSDVSLAGRIMSRRIMGN
ncbi:MAG TPA: lysine--tRNA ligase, partial [Bacteroidales bacterium]|nr:lysine--tRNA ligase [Bacteroidales bacterium]